MDQVLSLQDADPHAGVLRLTAELQNKVAEHAHNDYLEIWMELGAFGFGAFLLVISVGIYAFVSAGWRRGGDGMAEPHYQEICLMRAALFGAVFCMLVNAAVSFPLHMPARAWTTWILIGAFFATDRLLRELPSSNSNSSIAAEAPRQVAN